MAVNIKLQNKIAIEPKFNGLVQFHILKYMNSTGRDRQKELESEEREKEELHIRKINV